MLSLFTQFFEEKPLSGKVVYIKMVSLVSLVIFSGISIMALMATLRKAETGFLLSNPLALIMVLVMIGLPYLSPALLAALLFKLRCYILSLSVVVLPLVVLIISWQFAYKNEMLFSIYSRFSFFFESISIPKVPQDALVPTEASFPSGIHNSQTMPFFDRYFLRINYPAWELGVTGKDTVVRGLNITIEYSYYPGKQCTDISMIPKQSGAGYKGMVFQSVQCREKSTCTIAEFPKGDGVKNVYIHTDDDKGCASLRVDNLREGMFSTPQLLDIINMANRS